MVRLKNRVGPKGQIVIPKALREAYNIVEEDIVIIEPREDGILIRKIADPDKVIEWIKARRKRINGKIGRLGDLRTTDSEKELRNEYLEIARSQRSFERMVLKIMMN